MHHILELKTTNKQSLKHDHDAFKDVSMNQWDECLPVKVS